MKRTYCWLEIGIQCDCIGTVDSTYQDTRAVTRLVWVCRDPMVQPITKSEKALRHCAATSDK
jgi:hypothetical protein